MKSIRKLAVGGALVAATLTGGALGASLIGSADAATTTTASTASTASTAATAPDKAGGPHAANGITETPLTGDTLAKATAAAKAAQPGATVVRAETDAEGAKYEVHMTKADGSQITVKLDANFKVTSTVDGRG
jgi:uncharacterized membrane protein YkoI